MNFKQFLERTLYHGTVIDNEPDILKFGLVGGWNGIGSFVNQAYGSHDYEPTEDDEIVFLTDKQQLGKAVTAMVHHISEKLGKDFHSVTDNDIRNHGLLVVVKDVEPGGDIQQAEEEPMHSLPMGVEPLDYYTPRTDVNFCLKGSKLINFLKRYGEMPRTWGPNAKKQ